jgi:hypothetical protein
MALAGQAQQIRPGYQGRRPRPGPPVPGLTDEPARTVSFSARLFFIPAYPFWSLLIIAADVVALWGLCVYGSRENLGVA